MHPGREPQGNKAVWHLRAKENTKATRIVMKPSK